jgi:lipopolysaccharide transport system ATP-binding protein
MADVAIRCEGLGKQYRIAERQSYKTFRDTLAAAASRPFRRFQSSFGRSSAAHQASNDSFWALDDVSFEVKRGEVVGIIGRNGAGKSTLLKILSRITEPTKGRVVINGRVGSLLEVGTGFNPELTGRENIYLNGAILGMKKAEIERRFDEIVAFAEVEKFIESPVKRYSSGMYVRLAFAVAAHLEPEIMMVDEVLAVGDAQFQKKCLGRMSDVGKEGRTILFVSHNMSALQNLCRRAVWLSSGRIIEDGESSLVVSRYLKSGQDGMSEQIWPDPDTAPGCESVRLRAARVRALNDDNDSGLITVDTPFALEFEYWNLEPENYLNLSVIVYDEQGVVVFNAVPSQEPIWHGRPFPPGLFRSVCEVPGGLMNDGSHTVELLVVKNQAFVTHRHADVLVFDIHDVPDKRLAWYGKRIGATRPRLNWRTELVEPL